MPVILDLREAVVQVSFDAICTSDLHSMHGSVPRAVPGITVGHKTVGWVEGVGSALCKTLFLPTNLEIKAEQFFDLLS